MNLTCPKDHVDLAWLAWLGIACVPNGIVNAVSGLIGVSIGSFVQVLLARVRKKADWELAVMRSLSDAKVDLLKGQIALAHEASLALLNLRRGIAELIQLSPLLSDTDMVTRTGGVLERHRLFNDAIQNPRFPHFLRGPATEVTTSVTELVLTLSARRDGRLDSERRMRLSALKDAVEGVSRLFDRQCLYFQFHPSITALPTSAELATFQGRDGTVPEPTAAG